MLLTLYPRAGYCIWLQQLGVIWLLDSAKGWVGWALNHLPKGQYSTRLQHRWSPTVRWIEWAEMRVPSPAAMQETSSEAGRCCSSQWHQVQGFQSQTCHSVLRRLKCMARMLIFGHEFGGVTRNGCTVALGQLNQRNIESWYTGEVMSVPVTIHLSKEICSRLRCRGREVSRPHHALDQWIRDPAADPYSLMDRDSYRPRLRNGIFFEPVYYGNALSSGASVLCRMAWFVAPPFIVEPFEYLANRIGVPLEGSIGARWLARWFILVPGNVV